MGSWIWSRMNVKVSCCWWVLGFEAKWMWKYHVVDGFLDLKPNECESIMLMGSLDLKLNECESIMLLMGSWIWSWMNVKVSCWWVLGLEAEWMWKYHVVDRFLDLKPNECEIIMLMGSWIGSRMNVKGYLKPNECERLFEAKWMWKCHVDGFLDWKPNECESMMLLMGSWIWSRMNVKVSCWWVLGLEAEWRWKYHVIWSRMNVKVSCWWVLGLEAEWMWKYDVVDGFLDLKLNECESIMLIGSWNWIRMSKWRNVIFGD